MEALDIDLKAKPENDTLAKAFLMQLNIYKLC